MSVLGPQTASDRKLVPVKIGQAEFLRSNIFISWSPKAGREARLVGPGLFDAWLLLEFDADVLDFCERPPLAISLALNDGRSKHLDFWVRHRSGKQYGIVLHDANLPRDASISIDLLRRSVERAEFACEIWIASDVRRRLIYLRNIKQLLPFLARQQTRDIELEEFLLAHVSRSGRSSWMDLASIVGSRHPEDVDTAIAFLIHSGKVTADLSSQPLTNSTVLESR